MGQKVNPYGFRLGITTDWKSRWFSERNYKEYLTEDWKIRAYIMESLPDAAISRIEVERTLGQQIAGESNYVGRGGVRWDHGRVAGGLFSALKKI